MKANNKKFELEEISSNKGVDSLWVKDGYDFILHLGTMKKAIVVAYYRDGVSLSPSNNGIKYYYAVSPRSYFPFKDEDYNKRFSDSNECKKYAISKVREWLKSIWIKTNVDNS